MSSKPGRFGQLFLDCYGNVPPVVRALASGMDEYESRLEKCRIALGFLDDWSPAYDRRQRSGVSAAVKWADKAGGINGTGDLNRFIGELAEGMDILESKMGEMEGRLLPPPQSIPVSKEGWERYETAPSPEKRGPGRPRKVVQ